MEKNNIFRKNALERVSSPEHLNRYIRVATPGVVIVVAALLLILLGALVWAFTAVLPESVTLQGVTVASKKGQTDRMICIVDEQQASRLEKGMEVQVSPGTAPREEYGYIQASVRDITTYPVSMKTLTKMVGNRELARSLYGDRGGKVASISLKQDQSAANGLAWSSEQGKDAKVFEAGSAEALIILKEYHPIDLALKGGETQR